MVSDEEEKLVLTRYAAKKIAEERRATGFDLDPFPDVKPSLLSDDFIDQYIRATGLICPYYRGGRKRPRLKKASYEGRIGNAYKFNDENKIEKIDFIGGVLTIPANAIVFVECDLDFRLPSYIALRFNLQIRHVHRGLLLGTGPLVDPGYWGKLCIPLHNLTSEDYSIPITAGLIWIEFTKLISNVDWPSAPLAHDEYWDVKKFLINAAQPYDEKLRRVGIRNSIPTAVAVAEKSALDAKKIAKRTRKQVLGVGFVAIIGVALAVFVFLSDFVQGTYGQVNEARVQINNEIKTQSESMYELRLDIENSLTRNKFLETRINALELEKKTIQKNYQNLLERMARLEGAKNRNQ